MAVIHFTLSIHPPHTIIWHLVYVSNVIFVFLCKLYGQFAIMELRHVQNGLWCFILYPHVTNPIGIFWVVLVPQPPPVPQSPLGH